MSHRKVLSGGIFEYQVSTGDVRYGTFWRDPSGRQKEKGGFTTKTAARQHRARKIAERADGRYRDASQDKLTFGEWTDRWWAAKQAAITPNTAAQYESLLRLHVLPELGRQRLVAIRKIDVEALVAALRAGGLGSSGVVTSKKLVGQILAAAVDNGLITSNPAAGVRLARTVETQKHALTADEVERLADAVPAVHRALVLVLAYGGLRPGEAAALQRQDLDDLGQLHVRASVAEVRGHLARQEATKTNKRRVVPLEVSVLAELRAHMEKRVLWAPDAPIFTAAHGGPLRVSIFRRTLRETVKRLDLPSWVTPYTLRHTCASQLAHHGVHPHVAAKFMGHDPSEFLRTYVHLYPGDLRAAADALAGLRSIG